MSRSSASQTIRSSWNSTEEIESYGEKCANLCRVYKLIMISRVPSYGQLEYLEVNYWLISSRYLINVLGYHLYLVILGLSWANLLNNGINLVENKIYSVVVGKNWLYAKL